MSVAALAAELRRAVAIFPTALLDQAATLLAEAQAGFAEAAQGTNAHELTDAIRGIDDALAVIGNVRQTAAEVEQTIERYLAHIGAGGTPNSTPASSIIGRPPQPANPPPARPPLSAAARELVTEVQRRSEKINPDQVVRIEKPNRIVWLEEGNERAGLAHLLADKRVADFARHGIDRDEIVDAVFTALTKGTPIGITGRDRVVHAVEYQGRPLRIAVSVGNNGFIVGANPVSLDRKVKPLP